MVLYPHQQPLLQLVQDLSAALPGEQIYQRLITTLSGIFPCDAAALMVLQGEELVPVALHGLAPELIGRRFRPDEHPRLAQIMASRQPVRFPADTRLPDPFDGQLAADPERQIDVHACMGCSLYVEDNLVGVLTLDALRPGAFDEIDDIQIAISAALAAASLRNASLLRELKSAREQQHAIAQELVDESRSREGELIGDSPAMANLRQAIEQVAPSDLFVLITGETGTGKELVARTVHARSRRARQQLIYVNCAALPAQLAESELFGHTKGAFTGAVSERKGKFELADGGTLFLDEVGELPLELQAKLLRALQQGEIQRVGSDSHKQVDVRVLAATNRDLPDEINQGRFRADLYHRLRVFPLTVPPLREHKEDLPALIGHFLSRARHRLGVQQLGLHPSALAQLQAWEWPGNVRELEHLLLRASLMARRPGQSKVRIDTCHLEIPPAAEAETAVRPVAQSTALTESVAESATKPAAEPASLRDAVDDFQRRLISNTLAQHQGNWSQAAAALNTDRGNLYRLGKRLGLMSK